jgi:DNA-binding response OmpR family regulator
MARILIVDDDQVTRSVIRAMLTSDPLKSHTIIEAANGTECLMAAENKGPLDLILLDINMPDIDGFSICKAIRRVDSEVPVVFVTARGDIEDRIAGREAGCDSYVVKPVQQARLVALVNLLTSDAHTHTGFTPPLK